MKKLKTLLMLLGTVVFLALGSETRMVGAGEFKQQPAPTYTRMPPPPLASPTLPPATETPEPPTPTSPAPTATALAPQSSPLPATPAQTLAPGQTVTAMLPESGGATNNSNAWIGVLGGGLVLALAVLWHKNKRLDGGL